MSTSKPRRSNKSIYPHVLPNRLLQHVNAENMMSQLRLRLGGNQNEGFLPSGCQVWGREDALFQPASMIFNGAIKTSAIILVRPRNAEDVSKTIIFCRDNSLEISVKSGGFGTHGWSVAGDLIIDLALLDQVSISLPSPSAPTLQESFERLRLEKVHTPPPTGRGSSKRSADAFSEDSSRDGKKRSEEEEVPPSRSDSRSSDEDKDVDGDFEMVASGSNPSKQGSGSTTRSSERSGSTAETSASEPEREKLSRQLSNDGEGRSSSSSGGQTPLSFPRTTYVNPQPTATGSFPFVTTSFGTGPSGSSAAFPNLGQGFLRPSHLALNTHPDPPPYTIVTFGSGAHSKQIDAVTAASPYGAFHVPSSAFPVGAGQFVSGGFGFLGRKHGMAMDNIVEAELVLADGRVVWVGENGRSGGEWKDGEDPSEVWWALRGAGAVMAVVTRFRAKAYYVPSVYAGNFIFLFDRSTAPGLLRHVRDCIKGSPRTLYANIIMTAGPPGAPAIIVIQLCFSGPRSEGELYVQTIGAWDGGRCLFQDFSERTFERQQLAVEEVLKGGVGRRWYVFTERHADERYIKSDLLKSLSDEVIDESCARFIGVPDGCTWLFEFTGGGAVADVKDSCFPTSHREAAFTVAALHQWGHDESPDEDNRCVTTAEEWIDQVINPNSPGGPLPCFLSSAKEEAVVGVYGEANYNRLRAVKTIIDPANFFRHASWPFPTAPDERRQLGDEEETQEEYEEKGKMKETIKGNLYDALSLINAGQQEGIRAVKKLRDEGYGGGIGAAASEAAMEDRTAQGLPSLVEPINEARDE